VYPGAHQEKHWRLFVYGARQTTRLEPERGEEVINMWKIEKLPDKLFDPKSSRQPCPECGIYEASPCGYLDFDGEDYDCQCDDPEVVERGYDCDGCPKIKCSACISKVDTPLE
jgi:hypothetical protein